MKATANFDITGWDPASSDQPDAGPELSRVVIRKTFQGGDIEGESEGGRAVLRYERSRNRSRVRRERAGHGTTRRPAGQLRNPARRIYGAGAISPTFGHVVPGSGTGDLVGLTGEVEIDRTEDGEHMMTPHYDFATNTAAKPAAVGRRRA